MNVYCYIMYQTNQKVRGTFRVRVDHFKLKETLHFTNTVPVNEFGDACREFARCINRIDTGTSIERLFQDSVLSSEMMAYYLLAASSALKNMFSTNYDSALHLTYTFNAADEGKYNITENIYPGPDVFAPEHAIDHWMKTSKFE